MMNYLKNRIVKEYFLWQSSYAIQIRKLEVYLNIIYLAGKKIK